MSVTSGTVSFAPYSNSFCSAAGGGQVFFSVNSVIPGPIAAIADSDVVPRNLLDGSRPLFWQAIYSGDSQNQLSASPCTSVNLAQQRISVALGFAYQIWGSHRGASITVPWWASGVIDQVAVLPVSAVGADLPAPSGIVEFVLVNGLCERAGSRAVFSSTNEVTNGLAQSDPVGQLAPGTYYWIDIYNGDISYYGNQSDCGGQPLIVTSPIGGPASSSGAAVTLRLSCPVAVCRFRVSVTAALPLAADARHRGKRNPPVITLARGIVTIRKGSAQQVTLRLTSAGRRFVASHHGRVTATATIATTINGHTSVLAEPPDAQDRKARQTQAALTRRTVFAPPDGELAHRNPGNREVNGATAPAPAACEVFVRRARRPSEQAADRGGAAI